MSLFLEKSEKLVLVRLIKFAAPGLMQHILAVWCGAHPKVYVLLNHTIFLVKKAKITCTNPVAMMLRVESMCIDLKSEI